LKLKNLIQHNFIHPNFPACAFWVLFRINYPINPSRETACMPRVVALVSERMGSSEMSKTRINKMSLCVILSRSIINDDLPDEG